MVEPIVKRAGGLDVHKKSVVASVVLEQEDGTLLQETRTFGTTGEPRRALCAWLKENRMELVVRERTGIYWKSVYAALEEAGLKTYVVNARQVNQVPGRKTDVSDSQWLASLARFGLLKTPYQSVGRRTPGHRRVCHRGDAPLSAAVGNSSNYPRH